jgi:adenosylhomocysteine nucleosidase
MKRLFVAALKEEVPNLDFFHFTGVGKINATHAITQLILKHKPEEIVNFGSVGSLNKEIKGLIEVTKFYQRDMDVRGLMNLKLGETPFDSIHEIITNDAGYSCGTGDSFVNKKIDMEVDVVDMEAYAIAKVCKLENIEFKCFKYISDNADQNASNDWNTNLILGAKAFAELINFSKLYQD